ncbi:MAG: hypothetical protein IJ767_08395 [Bacteroidaceae bacterium]|nr:hypothetical protein [Bacteroidaceae bacterium]
MKFFKGIGIIFCIAVTSMFYFPFEFRALPPGMNTKKLMAAAALVILLWKMVQKQELKADKSFFYLTILAGLVSFCGIFSVTYNSTEDYAYATYITSCWVWWGAAYTACQVIKWVHGRITWVHVVNYLTAVSVFQCFLALAMDQNKPLKQFVNSIALQEDLVFKGNVHRLYGLGAELDVAGSRFAAVVIMIIFVLATTKIQKRWYEYLIYLLAFVFITVAGNMIARTTLLGIIISLAYLGFLTIRQTTNVERNYTRLWKWIFGVLVVAIPLAVYSYNTNPQIRKNMRFGFEGFFNYFEKGSFSYDSNETLKNMYVWPDNLKTWIIGDGYFNNPVAVDPYFTGEITEGYYKNTDVGYLRFIFYFGMIGLLTFSFYFIEVGRTCIHKFPQWRMMFLLLLLLHFTVWAKVSTDIFLCFAPFLCIDNETEDLEDDEDDSVSDSRDV